MTKFKALFEELQADFAGDEIKEIPKKKDNKGRPIRYATARTFMNRLDSVLGPENWWDEYTPGEHSVICRLTIRLPDGTTLTKSDAGGFAGMADDGDDDKSGFSDAFKRTCVKFGVGRHLYNDGMPTLRNAGPGPVAIAATPGDPSPRAPWVDQPGTAVPQAETPVATAVDAEPQSARLEPFWTYMERVIENTNREYRDETGDQNGCVDVRKAVKSVVDLTYRSGRHTFDPTEARTAKQWREVIAEIESSDPANWEWMKEYLRSHIQIQRETAVLQFKKGAN